MLLYLDCDTGTDDALALALLLARDDVTIAGIGTVGGNTPAAQAAANTLGVLALAGRDDIPVAAGGGSVRVGPHGHGHNGVGGAVLPEGGRPDRRSAPELLADLARRHPGQLHLLATGPYTNLAAALRAEPRLPSLIASATLMGGRLWPPGAETNVATDAAAAAAVLAAPWPLTLVPLDLTMTHRWSPADQQSLAAGGTPLHTALAAMLPAYLDFYEAKLGERCMPLHDPLAAALVAGELSAAEAPLLGLRVDVPAARIVEDDDAHRVRVVRSVDRPAGPVILERILRIPSPASRHSA
jgi:purine nucleosidase